MQHMPGQHDKATEQTGDCLPFTVDARDETTETFMWNQGKGEALNDYATQQYIETGAILPPFTDPQPAPPTVGIKPPAAIPVGPSTELPPEIERRILAAAIFRIVGKSADSTGANTFGRAIADLEQQIRDTPFAVHLMTIRLKDVAGR